MKIFSLLGLAVSAFALTACMGCGKKDQAPAEAPVEQTDSAEVATEDSNEAPAA
ncbi:MAG: hypothetical protein WC755_08165 [Candidatus Woesearchaeota archaeon]|jgi:hypothetical protein